MESRMITWDEGWAVVSTGIKRFRNKLEGINTGIKRLRNKLEGINCSDELHFDEYIRVYETICNLCSHNIYKSKSENYSQQIYDMYRKSLEEYISWAVLPDLSKQHDGLLLKKFLKRWENYKAFLRFMSGMFIYLKYHILWTGGRPLIEVGFFCFLEALPDDTHINLKNVVIDLIEREREGEQIDSASLRNFVDMYLEIGRGDLAYYQNNFENSMFEDTRIYYARKAALWISEYSCPQYMVKAEECLQNEERRVDNYFHSSSKNGLLDIVQDELLARYETQVLGKSDSGFDELLRDGKKIDVSRICRLFCKIPNGLEPVASLFQQHIIGRGIELLKWADQNSNSSNSRRVQGHEFVEKVIEIYDKYVDYLQHEFQNENSISNALNEAFLVICNKRVGGITSPELFASFWDYLLKKGSSVKRTDDDNIEGLLEKFVKLVQYVSDKDLFAEFSRKYLAGRLLHDRGVNIDDEQNKLSKLKEPCGFNLLSKMEDMVKDFVLSKETQAEFDNSAYNDMKLRLAVTELNAARWPTLKSSKLYLPSEMAECLVKFNKFYSLKYKNRKITWVYSLGTCDIISKFDTSVIELAVTTYQAALLLLFNEARKLSYEEIKSQLNLEDEDVIRLLNSFSCGKYKILLKEPITTPISTSDNFEFNPSFSHKLKKLKIPLTEVKMSENENESNRLVENVKVNENERNRVIENVEEDRQCLIDSAIVRIMKARKILPQQQLLSECVELLQSIFKPEFKAIEARIEELILKEYLERDKENSNLLIYLA